MTSYSKSRATVNQLTPADLEYVSLLQPEGWGDILSSIRFYCSSQFCHPLKATLDGKMAGIGTAIIYGNTAWLAHIIVHKDHRNAGIGTTITQSLIDLVRKTPCQTLLLLATTLGEPVYRKLGFSIQTQYIFLDHGKLPGPTAQKYVVPFHPRYEQALFELDRRVSGEDRRTLFKAHLSDAKLFIDHNELEGFYVPTLGEGLIISTDPGAGVELMKHKWATNKMFCIPVENEHGINFLKRHGFNEFRKASRMIMGEKINWDGSQIYSRIGGNLG